MRSRTNDLKWNYKEKYKQDLSCSPCRKYPLESESHLLNCEEMKMENEISEEMNKIEDMDIYGRLEVSSKNLEENFQFENNKVEEDKIVLWTPGAPAECLMWI